MSEKNVKNIVNKYNDEDKRRAMAKRMAEEEQRRNDLNMEHWDGMQSRGMFRFSMSSWKWENLSITGRIFTILFVAAGIILIGLFIFLTVRSLAFYNRFH